jgi:hypothetical protein
MLADTKKRNWPWEYGAFKLAIYGGIQFFVLTIIAMFLYAGGNYLKPEAGGYNFFNNFFSDLGRTVSYAGESNTASLILWTVAMGFGGLTLGLFFVASIRYCRQSRSLVPSILSGFFGLIAGASFIGVAFTPADVALESHVIFVQTAFLSFLVASIFYIPTIVLHHQLPNRYTLIFIVFTIILGSYVWLLFFGPSADTDSGRLIQVTGQKIVAYASVVTVLAQSFAIRRTMVASELRLAAAT